MKEVVIVKWPKEVTLVRALNPRARCNIYIRSRPIPAGANQNWPWCLCTRSTCPRSPLATCSPPSASPSRSSATIEHLSWQGNSKWEMWGSFLWIIDPLEWTYFGVTWGETHLSFGEQLPTKCFLLVISRITHRMRSCKAGYRTKGNLCKLWITS